MKKQTRPAEPEVLQKNASKWNSAWTSLRASNPSAKFNWYQIDGRSAREWILPALREMNQCHCSFCDAFPLEATTNEPIEHFKPKSDYRFYAEAYNWHNLFYSCDFCQRVKGEKWSDELIAPDTNEYSFHDYFMFDFTTGAISPNPRALADTQARAQTTIAIYGLDLDPRRRMRLTEARKWSKSIEHEIDSWAYRDFVNPQGLT